MRITQLHPFCFKRGIFKALLVWGFDTHTSTMFTAGFTYFFSQGYLKYINRFLMKYPWIPNNITFSINKYLKEFISFTFQFVFNWCEKKHCSYLIYSPFVAYFKAQTIMNHEESKFMTVVRQIYCLLYELYGILPKPIAWNQMNRRLYGF